jgi:hypothetical protein
MNEAINDIERRVVDLMRDHNIESYEYSLERHAYSGRGMFGERSPLSVITKDDWTLPSTDPQSEIGATLINMGFFVDNMGLGFVYFLKGVTP